MGFLLPLLPSLKGQFIKLSPDTKVRLEELLLEGDLLEVTLDQTLLLHRVLQAASVPPRETLHTLIQVSRINPQYLERDVKFNNKIFKADYYQT